MVMKQPKRRKATPKMKREFEAMLRRQAKAEIEQLQDEIEQLQKECAAHKGNADHNYALLMAERERTK